MAAICIEEPAEIQYYDIVVFGKTGMGKSSTGNKLLGLDKKEDRCNLSIRQFAFSTLLQTPGNMLKFDVWTPECKKLYEQSFTQGCQLLANNKTKVRVLDVPGFSATDKLMEGQSEFTIRTSILGVIRRMVRVQTALNLNIKRLLYFLPYRGPIEKADKIIQEELQQIHLFFGDAVFSNMVVVATQHPKKKYQDLGMDEEDMEMTANALQYAIDKSIHKMTKYPPLIYIPCDKSGEDILREIKCAEVLDRDSTLPITIKHGVCAQCSDTMVFGAGDVITGMKNKHNQVIPYKESTCHPTFVQKYSKASKIAGGMAHVATLGFVLIVGKIIEKKTWPGFTNSDEICPVCKGVPGSEGCCSVNSRIRIPGKGEIRVHHSNKILCIENLDEVGES